MSPLALAVLLAAAPAAAEPPQIAASATATVRAAPDRAVVHLGVEVQAPQAAEAQGHAAELLAKVVAVVKKQGIPAERIATERMDLSPVYESPDRSAPRLAGYRASSQLRITVNLGDGARAGAVLDAAVAAGANQVEGITFELADDSRLRISALTEAARQARTKVQALAQALGVTVGPLVSASEGNVDVFPPRPMMTMRAAAPMESMPVMPGEVQVQATVQVSYAAGLR